MTGVKHEDRAAGAHAFAQDVIVRQRGFARSALRAGTSALFDPMLALRSGGAGAAAARHAGHAVPQQTCLAHLDCDARFADENSDEPAPMRMRLWFRRAFALARDIERIAVSTLRAKRRLLERDLTTILNTSTSCPLTQELLAKGARASDQLLTICDSAGEVGPTNNLSARKLRPCVIQRKVTNDYRSAWAADFEASVRTAVDTALLAGAGPFQTLLEIVVR